MSHKTPQEDFWTSTFAKGYIERNQDYALSIPSRAKMFSEILDGTRNVTSATELGANIGLNLLALKTINLGIRLNAVEINPNACENLSNIPDTIVHNKSLLTISANEIAQADISFTSGVLIHINPEELTTVYDLLYQSSSRYIMIAEYYNPTPMMIPYHGKDNVLFKRDFAGEILDRFPDLKLINYGFKYRRDNNFPLDDLTWFLMEK